MRCPCGMVKRLTAIYPLTGKHFDACTHCDKPCDTPGCQRCKTLRTYLGHAA